MPNPDPQPCGLCEYKTPAGCPSYRDANEALRLHVETFHSDVLNRGPSNDSGAGAKMEKLRRPTLEEDISESDWNFFKSKWTRYKRATKLAGQDVVDQLWACMSEGLERQCHDHGASADSTTEAQLLELLKVYCIRGQNKLCNVVEFLNLKQIENEPIQKFISRVRSQALTCDFKIKCSKVGCSQETSYADKLSSHIIVKGLYDPNIQEDVLKIAAGTDDELLDLKKVTEVVLAQETGIRSRRLLNNENVEINKLSQYKKNQRDNSKNNLTNADIKVQNEVCTYCGEKGHGHRASVEVRQAMCPAFGKQCKKCGVNNHYTSLCMSKNKKENGTVDALEAEERSSSSGSDNDNDEEYGWFTMSSKRKRKNKVMDPLPHYEMDKFGKWKAKAAEPHPEITVNVKLCKEGYKEIGAAPPRCSPSRSVSCRSLPDTGSQIVVAGPKLLNELKISKHELFPVAANIKSSDKKFMQLIGGLLITISTKGSDGRERCSSQMCYIGEQIENLFLSREACVKLDIIDKTFPKVGSIQKNLSDNNLTLSTFNFAHMSMHPTEQDEDCVQFLDMRDLSDHEFSSLQHALHQPTSQQMPGTSGTVWRTPPNPIHQIEFGDGVANILKTLSQLDFAHQLQLPAPGDNRM